MENKTTRLKRLKRNQGSGRTKVATPVLDLAHITTKSGDLICFSARIVNWEPWYKVVQEMEYESFDFYNGPDFNRAARMYKDILLAFKGSTYAEDFDKQATLYMEKIHNFASAYQHGLGNEMVYSRTIVPKFLGFQDM